MKAYLRFAKIRGVLPCRRCLFVTGDPSVLSGLAAACTVPRRRSIRWRRRGSSVAVFRLGVLRYNHMTVGRKQPRKKRKNSRCTICSAWGRSS